MKIREATRVDNDTPWKQSIEGLFKPFMTFCFPNISNDINWNKPIKELDKELLKLYPSQKLNKHIADKLFEVKRHDSKYPKLFIHIEIQSQKEDNFARRMFWYHVNIRRKFNQPLLSIALLTDEVKNWKPYEYVLDEYNCYVKIHFLSVKLLEFRNKRSTLMESDNPFSAILLTYLAKIDTKGSPKERLKQKLELTRLVENKGWTLQETACILGFIQWVLVLPEEYELEYKEAIKTEDDTMLRHFLEEEAIERGLKKGMEQGMEKGEHDGLAKALGRLLELRFKQPLTDDIKTKLQDASLQELEGWTDRILTADSVEEVLVDL